MWLSFDQILSIIVNLTFGILGNIKTWTWGAKNEFNTCMHNDKGDKVCTPIFEVVKPYNCAFWNYN